MHISSLLSTNTIACSYLIIVNVEIINYNPVVATESIDNGNTSLHSTVRNENLLNIKILSANKEDMRDKAKSKITLLNNLSYR